MINRCTVKPVYRDHNREDQKWSLKKGGLCPQILFLLYKWKMSLFSGGPYSLAGINTGLTVPISIKYRPIKAAITKTNNFYLSNSWWLDTFQPLDWDDGSNSIQVIDVLSLNTSAFSPIVATLFAFGPVQTMIRLHIYEVWLWPALYLFSQ